MAGPGDDILIAVAGSQLMDGEGGIDLLDMQNAGVGGAFVDLDSNQAFSGGTGFDTLANIENVKGSAGDDALNGDEGANTFFATAGSDVINGRDGDDTFDASAASTSVTIDLSTSVNSVTGAFTADLTSIENAVGGSGDDTFTGSSADNTIVGNGGVDTVVIDAAISAEDVTVVTDADPFTAGDQAGWQVDGGTEGTDTLAGVEIVEGTDGNVLLVGNGGFATIQDAIDEADAGDTIMIAAGTYDGFTVGTADLNIVAVGEVIIEGPLLTELGVPVGTPLNDFFEQNHPAYSASTGIAVNADGVSISGLTVTGFAIEVELGTSDGVSLTDNTFTDNVTGIRKGTAQQVTDLTVSDNVFTQGIHGITIYAAEDGSGAFDDITMDGNSFSALSEKGMYFEQLSNASLVGNEFDDVGNYGRVAPPFGPAGQDGEFGQAIDINLKYETYENVTFTDTVITDSGNSNKDGAGATGAFGAAIGVKIRDDAPSYSTTPADFTGQILFDGLTIDGTSTGVRIGEPGKNNDGPDVQIQDFKIDNATVTDIENATDPVSGGTTEVELEATQADLDASASQADVDVVGNDLGNTISTGSGDDSIEGRAGDDVLHGGDGLDEAVYVDPISIDDVTAVADADPGTVGNQAGWQVDAGAEGTNSLNDVEVVNEDILLVGNGGFDTIQEAIDAADAGDTILIAAGTYDGFTVGTADLNIVAVGEVIIEGPLLTELGVPVGTPLNDFFEQNHPAYSASTGIAVNADDVSISGLTVTGFAIGVELGTSDGVSLTDNTFIDNVTGIRKGTGQQVTDLTVSNNVFTQGIHGITIYAAADGSGSFDDITMDNNSFSALSEKGMYFEQLSNASLVGNEFEDVGNYGRVAPPFGPALQDGEFGQAIDINLKYETYENVTFTDTVITNSGNSDQDGAGEPGAFGAAVGVKIRDDAPSYSTTPADFTGQIVFDGLTIDGTSTGVRIGEPGKDNDGPNVLLQNFKIDNATVTDVENVTDPVSGGTATVELEATQADLDASASQADVDVVGNDLGNTISTGSGDDSIDGGEGDDALDGGAGADDMTGGAGNDTYVVDDLGDTVTEDADAGTDEVQTTLDHTLGADVENLTLLDLDENVQTFDDMALGPIANGENGWNDFGPADDQEIVDLAGNQVWRISSDPASGDFGGPYSPSLSVTAGEPQTTADGEFQSVTFRIKPVSETPDDSRLEVDIANANGTDRNTFMVIESTGDGIRIAVNDPNLDGSWANDDFSAFTGNVTLIEGVDPTVWHEIELRLTYVDGPDNDVMGVYLDGELIGTSSSFENYRDSLGGTHEDNAEANQTSRIIFRGGNGGQPTDGPGGQNQGFYFDDVTSTVANNASGTGNELDNVITGNSGDNALSGLGGADTIDGGEGNDTITGGGGIDDLSGGEGDDTFVETLGEGVDTIDGGAGNDTLALSGSSGDDSLDVNMSGGLLTGTGEDVTDVENITLDLDGNGADGDTLSYAGSTDAVTVNLETGEATGFESIAGVENVTGGSNGNSLTGNAGDNVLTGGGGDDLLNGGAGNDTAEYDATLDVSDIATNGSGGWTVTTGGAEGTDTLEDIEIVDGAGDSQILLVGDGGFATIQAAVDAAAEGDTILIADGTYAENVTIDTGVTLVAADGATVTISPTTGNAVTISGDLGGADVSILGIDIVGTAAAPNQGIGVFVDHNANVGILTLDDVSISDAGSYGVFVDGEFDATAADEVIITNSTFENNGYNGANGSAHIKIYGFTGDALIQNVTIDGAAPATPVAQRPDYGIEITGMPNDHLATDDSPSMGEIVIDNVTLTGWYHKNGLAVFNFADIDGLAIGGANGDLDLSAIVTDWGPVLNIDGIEDDIDASGYDVALPGSGITTEIQGDKIGQDATDQTITGTGSNDRLIGKNGNDELHGGAGDDELFGHDKPGGGSLADIGNDELFGEAGSDTLSGGAGNDTLDGGTEADSMAGGTGDDTYVVDDANDAVVEISGQGTDLVESSIDHTLSSNVENLTLTGTAINGTGNSGNNVVTGNSEDNSLDGAAGDDTLNGGIGFDTLTGGTQNDTLNGGADDDVLIAGAGNDTLDGGSEGDFMLGGSGDDTYAVDDIGDTLQESNNQGTDLVQAAISFTLGANLENLTLTGAGNIDGTGNGGANTILGNSGNNALNGQGGADAMTGGLGNDTYVVDVVGDAVSEGASAGTDEVQAGISFTLAANFENLTLTGGANINGTGNGVANVMAGNSGNNVLNGQGGVDSMTGGAGNDTYVVDVAGDAIIENAGGGTDLVQSSITHTLAAEVENLTLTGAAAINGVGNGLANVIRGNSANNTLNGQGGADTMFGDLGDDLYIVDSAGDAVVENASAGTDRVQSSVTHSLANNVENLTLVGIDAITGGGNGLDNAIVGNSAANTLLGGGGNDNLNGGASADTMQGGLGNDTYFVDNAGDVAVEGAGNGTDTVQSSITYTLSANVDILVLNGPAAINGTGNASANTIYGNSAANRLDGNGGADVMQGFGGADVFVFDDGDGADTILDFQNGSDKFDLTAVAGVDEFSDLVVTDNGPTVTVSYGSGSFELANVANPNAIDASDFVFV